MGGGSRGREGWMDRGGSEKTRDQGMEGGREREGGLHPLLKGLKDIKSFWESDYSMQREKLALWSHYRH